MTDTTYHVGELHGASAKLNILRTDRGLPAAKRAVQEAFRRTMDEHGVSFEPIKWYEAEHAEKGLILIGEARIIDTPRPAPSVVEQLGPRDLERMREITRRAHRKARPFDAELTNAECDENINRHAPVALDKVLREAVDSGSVH